MSLSNAGMQGLRPGVCTSTTRPTNPYNGQIVYETDTGYLRVWDGAAWDYLSAKQNTTEGLPAETYMGLVKVTDASVTAGSTLTVNNCFSATYKNYLVVFSGISASSAVTFRLRNASADRTGNDYVAQQIVSYGTTLNSAASTSTSIDLGAITTEGFITIEVYRPFISTQETHGRYRMYGYQSNVTSFVTRDGGFNYNQVNQNDGFSLLATSLTAEVVVYGYRN